jgi:hypothetical protein
MQLSVPQEFRDALLEQVSSLHPGLQTTDGGSVTWPLSLVWALVDGLQRRFSDQEIEHLIEQAIPFSLPRALLSDPPPPLGCVGR